MKRIVARDVMVRAPAATVAVNLPPGHPPDHVINEAEVARLVAAGWSAYSIEVRFADFVDEEWEAAVASPETITHGRDDETGTVWRAWKDEE